MRFSRHFQDAPLRQVVFGKSVEFYKKGENRISDKPTRNGKTSYTLSSATFMAYEIMARIIGQDISL